MDRIPIGDHSEVVIGRGLPEPLLPISPSRRRTAILTQPTVNHIAERVRELVDGESAVRALPDREAAKTLGVAETTYEWLAELGLSRHDTVVGVGGGALTDIAGFVAATYLRGVEVVHVPTTLLGAVDASIGGKTAVNVAGKNLVGAFWHPSRVVIDIDVMDALPRPLILEGSAEAVKCGFIADEVLIQMFATDGIEADLYEVVRRSVAIKASVVTEDEREVGRRAHLNYGHTIGHAIEFATHIPHGHAVAIGMAAAAVASKRVTGYDAINEHLEVLRAVGLPSVSPAVDKHEILTYLARDKKRDHSGTRMTLLEGPQRPVLLPVDAATVDAALEAVGIS